MAEPGGSRDSRYPYLKGYSLDSYRATTPSFWTRLSTSSRNIDGGFDTMSDTALREKMLNLIVSGLSR